MNQKRSRATREPTKRSLIGREYPSAFSLAHALMEKEEEPERMTLKDSAKVAGLLRREGWTWVAIGLLFNRAPSTVRENYSQHPWL